MKVCLIEDDKRKQEKIIDFMSKHISKDDILVAETITELASLVHNDIGLFIIDFLLPSFKGGDKIMNARTALGIIQESGKQNSLLLAISSHPEDFNELREEFEAKGCILTDFNKEHSWKSTLNHQLVQLNRNISFDFVIVCALDEERRPYIKLLEGQRKQRGVLDCFDVCISGKSGTIVLLPNMGLVNAAIITSLCIEIFRPKYIGMSGICGGFENRVSLGQLVISTMAFEYQSGKWTPEGFREEHYQVSLDAQEVSRLRQYVDSLHGLSILESKFTGNRPSLVSLPHFGIFTSGSSVIADKQKSQELQSFHRKVDALDMEVFSVMRAAELTATKPICICAKVVVDLCNSGKNDDIHDYGSHISANFMIKYLESIFETKS